MEEMFPQLKGVGIDYVWGGTLGITMNRMPPVARVGKNVLNASGFSGHGVALSGIAGVSLPIEQLAVGDVTDKQFAVGRCAVAVPAGQVVDDPDLVSGGSQALAQRGADETQTAGDQITRHI